MRKILTGLLGKPQHLLRPPLEQHPVLRQLKAPLVPLKKLDAEILFQLAHLAGKGGLSQVENLRCPGHAAFLRHRKKIPQHSQFHILASYSYK